MAKWSVVFDVHQDEKGDCVVQFTAGEEVVVTSKDISVKPQ